MGNNFAYAQQNQGDDTAPEKQIAPKVSPINGIPARYPTHDEFPDLATIAAVSFLLGFKIAAWMGRHQIERLRKIWTR